MSTISPAKIDTVFRTMPFGIVLLDADGTSFYVNDTIVVMSGFNREELLVDGFFNNLFKLPEVRQRAREKSMSALTEAFDDLDINITNKTGETISIHIAGNLVVEGEDSFISLIIQNITSRKAFEKVIESSFDNFIQVTNALDGAIKKINEQNQILEDYKLKMTRELNIAKSVQKAIIPKVFPKIPHFDMFGVSVPSEELGGDYFDYFQLSEHVLGILIADVSGHGVPSSLITTMVKAYFEYYTKRYWEPDKVLYHVNKDMSAIIMDTGFYLTAFYAVLDLKTLKLTVSAAGHDSAICVTRGKEKPYRLGEGAEGTILGIFPDAEYGSISYQLEPNSKIIIFTDGITEARSDTGEFYGEERLEQFLLKELGNTAKMSVENLLTEVDAFYGTSHPNDDRTLVIFDILEGDGTSWEEKESMKTAKQLLINKDFGGALNELQRVLQNNGLNQEALYLAGQCASFLSDYRQAIEYFNKSLEIDPSSYKSYYYLGLVQHNLKEYPQALASWEKVLEINGNYKDCRSLLEKLQKKS